MTDWFAELGQFRIRAREASRRTSRMGVRLGIPAKGLSGTGLFGDGCLDKGGVPGMGLGTGTGPGFWVFGDDDRRDVSLA